MWRFRLFNRLRYSADNEDLRDLYPNLLATSMDQATTASAHPAFVEIIKNLSPDEARLLKLFASPASHPVITIQVVGHDGSLLNVHEHLSLLGFEAGCAFPQFAPRYLTNLRRLGLIEIPDIGRLADSSLYAKLEQQPGIQKLFQEAGSLRDGFRAKFHRQFVIRTSLGRQFITACVQEKKTPDVQAATGNPPTAEHPIAPPDEPTGRWA